MRWSRWMWIWIVLLLLVCASALVRPRWLWLVIVLGCSAARQVDPTPANLVVDTGQTGEVAASDNAGGLSVDLCTTTIAGTVTTPAVVSPDPLFNVVVYVPAEPVAPIVDGVACERCGPIRTKTVAVTKTDAIGHFELRGVVPGKDFPLVLERGRWRREVTVPAVERCTYTELPSSLTRMPRNQTEGHIPRIAVGTGNADTMECLLQRIGIDESEFTHPWQAGRVHIFRVNGAPIDVETPDGELLYDWPKHLDTYDIIVLPCEGLPTIKPLVSRQNIVDYANKGGRVFTSHYGYTWIQDSPDPGWAKAVTWDPERVCFAYEANVDTSFPKGKALADWLWHLKVSPIYGHLPMLSPRNDMDAMNHPTQRWLYSSDGPLQFTFNTPVGVSPDKQCGRVAYSDFHVVNSVALTGGCSTVPLDPQERVLEYLLFDLADCVQADDAPPVVLK